MNESTKTVAFVGLAGVVALTVWFTWPASLELDPEDVRGQRLFPDFDDPLAATSMDIVEFDEATSTVRPFQVAQLDTKDGKKRWSIPSHEDYPADAEKQLADAAAGLMGLEILDMTSDKPGDHELYGVIDPDLKTLEAGAAGVGTRVVMRDTNGKELLALIIGKEVPDRDGLRFIRRPGEDQVFTTAVRTDKLSTKFEDWIEEDLLKLNTFDVKQIEILDYSFNELKGIPEIRGQMTLEYDDTGDPKWKLTDDRAVKDRKWVVLPRDETEELDTSRLDTLKNALDDLKIVDVRRKPEGLSSNLREAKGLRIDAEARESLATRGFHLLPVGNEQVELFSNKGEVRCLMKDGVEYALRFGEIAIDSRTESSDEESESNSSGLDRYIFVMVEFNPEPIPKPELEPLPEVEEKPAADVKEDDKPAEDKAEEEADEKAAEKADEDESTGEEPESKPDPKAERERIEKENQRKQDEYDEKIKKGKDRVNELNARFADWYYVISDEVFQKIHLDRDAIFKKKEKDENAEEDSGEHDHAHDEAASPAGPLDELDKLRDGPDSP